MGALSFSKITARNSSGFAGPLLEEREVRLQKQYLYENLGKLDIVEKQIICMLYGLKPYKRPYSLAEIGKALGMEQ